MKGYGKIIAIIAAILLVGVVGIGFALRSIFRDLTGAKPISSASQSDSTHPVQSVSNVSSSDPAVNALMTKYNLDLKAATYLAGAKTQVVSQSNTSAQLALTFPDGLTADELITIQPEQHYTPTPAELEEATSTGQQIYNVKFSAVPDGGDRTKITLSYFVPYSAVPADLQQKIRGQQSSANWFQVVPSAWAQDAGGNAGVTVSSVFGVVGKTVGTLYNLYTGVQKNTQHANWMDQLDAMQDCVENPTNPVTQKAYADNPAYRDQTINGIENARSQVQQATGVRFLNQEASIASGFLGLAGLLTAPVSMWNDSTLKGVAQRQVDDISKSVTECKDQPPKPNQGDGTIVYTMHKEQSGDTEDRLYQGTFNLQHGPVESLVTVAGTAEIQSKAVSAKAGTTYTCKGVAQIHGPGGMGSLSIAIDTIGNCEMNDHGRVLRHPGYASQGISCSFQNVDLVNGGSYEVQSDGEEAQWTKCALELKPKQK